jgi:hypothetical protein
MFYYIFEHYYFIKMLTSPGFVYMQTSFIKLFKYAKIPLNSSAIQNISSFNTQTKFKKISNYRYCYVYNKSSSIWLQYTNHTSELRDNFYIFQFVIVYSDEKEFNKFKKENPKLRYDTFDEILEIEKDYNNEQDFRNDLKSRIQNMLNY